MASTVLASCKWSGAMRWPICSIALMCLQHQEASRCRRTYHNFGHCTGRGNFKSILHPPGAVPLML